VSLDDKNRCKFSASESCRNRDQSLPSFIFDAE
jgi:hypothetical protein